MPVSKLGQRRQVVIPKDICEELGLKQGDFVEVTCDPENGTVVIKPKKLVDSDDLLTPREEAIVRKAEQEIKRGEVVDWEDVKTELNL
ncbi:MAG: AbrB/MazE/SpoVT family DNA-binding domain-containing protein [Acidobacteria bacterium]|nr:AbrB/MazE/SpoVT family DNA-binding domain-containing protein [Acidobacteriota bacterium]